MGGDLPNQSLRDAVFANPVQVSNGWAGYSVEPPVCGPQRTTKFLRKSYVMRVVDRSLVKPACQFKRPCVQIRAMMKLQPRIKKTRNHQRAFTDV